MVIIRTVVVIKTSIIGTRISAADDRNCAPRCSIDGIFVIIFRNLDTNVGMNSGDSRKIGNRKNNVF